ncbi:outer membrane beta-barrel protein [Lysobacter sp. D1-1-M9]|uniref:outer membrane beta-barrel protein n=1 Tax=Novilysobacter longmucuonensis TaxID=3098603 RepID=UPI002FCC1676
MKRSLLALTLLSVVPALALSATATAAEGVSYTYLEGGYAGTSTDGGDADGLAINGSGAIAPNFHLFGGYSNQELDNSNIDFDQWRVGLGYNHEVNPRVDLLSRVAYEKFDAGRDFLGNDLSADGWSVEAGVRSALAPNFEGYALAGFEDGEALGGGDRDGDFYGRLGAQVKFNQAWGLAGDVKFVSGDTQFFVGPRISW